MPEDNIRRVLWFRRFRAKFDKLASLKIADIAAKTERAAELHSIHKQVRSANDEREANAVANLITALDTTDEAVIRLSSLILVKVDGIVVSHVLTNRQIKHLEDNPDLLKDPRTILDTLKQRAPAFNEDAHSQAEIEEAPDQHQHQVIHDE